MIKNKEKILIISFSLVLVLALILFFFFFSAQVTAFDFTKDSGLETTAEGAGYLESGATSVEEMIGKIITTILTFIGVVFMILMVYGGFLWMTDRGNEEQVGKAQKIITASLIGLLIALTSYAISYFVISSLMPQTPSVEESAGGDEWVDPRDTPDFDFDNY